MKKIIDAIVVTLAFLLAIGGVTLVVAGIWIGGDLLAKMVWTGIISFALGYLAFWVYGWLDDA